MPRRSDNEKKLFELLKARSFVHGRFLLPSGKTRKYNLDVRRTSVSAEGARLIGEVMFERLRTKSVCAVGGLAPGAIPLVSATVMTASFHGWPMEGFWVRPVSRKDGHGQVLEGALEEGARIAIVEEVVDTGENVYRAVKSAWELGCNVVAVISLVDLLEGCKWRMRNNVTNDYESIYTIEDFDVKPRDVRERIRSRTFEAWGLDG